MARPRTRKGYSPIVVQGHRLGWKVTADGVVTVSGDQNGSRRLAVRCGRTELWMHLYEAQSVRIVKPGFVAQAVQYALRLGWQPTGRGPDFVIEATGGEFSVVTNPAYQVRPETEADFAAVHDLLVAAFPTPAEAGLVASLRTLHVTRWISLVAEQAGKVVGHILFTPVFVQGPTNWSAMGLAPMAVHPGHQRKGVGGMLVRAGFEACRALGENVVFVLGHPEYYPRFGFKPTRPLGITCEFAVPENVYMVAELAPGALAGRSGVVHYNDAFRGV